MILADFPLKITIKLENLGLISYVFGLLFPNQSYYPKRTHLLSSKKSRLFIKVYCLLLTSGFNAVFWQAITS